MTLKFFDEVGKPKVQGQMKSIFALAVMLSAVVLLLPRSVHAEIPAPNVDTVVPGVELGTADPVSPADAWANYYSANGGTTSSAIPRRSAFVKDLARALKYDADLIYEHIHNRVEIVPMFGLQKGAVGAILANAGTSFDQAHLMVELLRESDEQNNTNYNPEYVYGQLNLSGAEFNAWMGVQDKNGNFQNAQVTCQMLADGGVPATVNGTSNNCASLGTGAVSSVTLAHVWVRANVGGQLVEFDPSYKTHEFFAGEDIIALMGGFDSNAMLAALQCGGTDCEEITAADLSIIENTIEQKAQLLEDHIKANYPGISLEEFVGGKRIEFFELDVQNPPRSLGVGTYSSTTTWSQHVPDVFRTKIKFAFPDSRLVPLNLTFFADEIAGERFWIEPKLSQEVVPITATKKVEPVRFYLRTDKEFWGPSLFFDERTDADFFGYPYASPTEAGTWPIDLGVLDRIEFQVLVDHPYSANLGEYMDAYYSRRLPMESRMVMIFGVGRESRIWPEIVGKYGMFGPDFFGSNNDNGYTGNLRYRAQDLFVTAATWQAQVTQLQRMQSGAIDVVTQHHHSIGFAYIKSDESDHYSDRAQAYPRVFDVDSAVSINPLDQLSQTKFGAFFTLASQMNALEAAALHEVGNYIDVSSTGSYFGKKFENASASTKVIKLSGTDASASAMSAATASYPLDIQAWVADTAASGQSLFVLNAGLFNDIANLNVTKFGTAPVFESAGLLAVSPNGKKVSHLVFGPKTLANEIRTIAKGAMNNSFAENAQGPTPAELAKVDLRYFAARLGDEATVGVDMLSGKFSFAPKPDIILGSGEHRLSLRRYYTSSHLGMPANMGMGWKHSLKLTLDYGTNTMVSLGANRAIDATRTLTSVLLESKLLAPQAPSEVVPLGRSIVLAELIGYHTRRQNRFNVATVSHGPNLRQYVKMIDGTFLGDIARNSQLEWVSGEPRVRGAFWAPRNNAPYGSGAEQFVPNTYSNHEMAFREVHADGTEIEFFTPSLAGEENRVSGPTSASTIKYPDSYQINFEYVLEGGYARSVGGFRHIVDGDKFVLKNVSDSFGNNLRFHHAHKDITLYDENTGEVSPNGPHDGAVRIIKVVGSDGREVEYGYTSSDHGIFQFRTPWNFLTFARLPAGNAVTYGYNGSGRTMFRHSAFTLWQAGIIVDWTDDYSTINRHEYPTTLLKDSFFSGDGFGSEMMEWAPFLNKVFSSTYEQMPLYSDDASLFDGTQAYFTSEPDLYTIPFPGVAIAALTYSDGFGNVERISDAFSHSAQFYVSGLRGETVDPLGNSSVTYYDFDGQPIRAISALGQTSTAEYDAFDRLIKITMPAGDSISYEYDNGTAQALAEILNNITKVVQQPVPNSGEPTLVTNYEYGDANWPHFVKAKIDPKGNRTDYFYNSSTGKLLRRVDPGPSGNRPQTQFSYTTLGRLIKETGPEGLETDYVYFPNNQNSANARGELQKVIHDAQQPNDFTSYVYDDAGNVVEETDPNGNTTKTSYDGNRRPILIEPPLGAAETRVYDPDGLLVQVEQVVIENGDVTDTLASSTFNYDVMGRLISETDPDGDTTLYTYDAKGRQDVVEDPMGRKSRTTYDPLDREIKLVEGLGTLLERTYRELAYDVAGNIISRKDGNGNETSYDYDGHHRLTNTTFPDDSVESYTYDDNGNRTSITTRKGDVVTFVYDQQDRVTSKTIPNADSSGTIVTNYTYDKRGLELSATKAGFSTTNNYDALGRLTAANENGRAINYAYDAAGNRVSMAWPSDSSGNGNLALTYDYDANNRLLRIEDGVLPTPVAAFTYDDLSRRASVTFGNGVQQTYAYENDNDLSSLAIAVGANTYTYSHTYNFASQLVSTSVTEPLLQWLPTDSSRTGKYAVNELNQIEAFVDSEPSLDNWTHDLNGNLEQNARGTYTHDAENRLTNVVMDAMTASYEYDAAGRRIRKTVDSTVTEFLLDGDHEIAEYDDAGNAQRLFVYADGVDDIVASFEVGTSEYIYAHRDRMGSVVAITDSAAVVDRLHSYSPYGLAGAEGSHVADVNEGFPFRYTGRRLDPETGFYYYRARYYDPESGRFLETDPVGYEDQMNLYAYVGNDPYNATDPSGQCSAELSGSQALCGIADAIADAIEPAIEAAMEAAGIEVLPPDQRDPNGVYAYEGPQEQSVTGEAVAVGAAVVSAGIARYSGGKKGKAFSPKDLKQQSADLVKQNGGKNRVTLRSSSQQMEVDLAGKSHAGIETPHVKISPTNTNAPGRVPVYNTGKKHSTVRPATQADIRAVRKYLERQ